jgi:phosphoribosylanthranilate isomerase
MMPRGAILKICGITNVEDAAAAVAGGANALGFIFFKGSPRYIEPEQAAQIHSTPGILRVGVFVNEDRDRVGEIARIASLHVAQLHGQEAPGDYPDGMPVWKAARVSAGFDVQAYRDCPAEALLLDGPASGLPFDWGLASSLQQKIILAGGLDASNVAKAVAIARPWGVDASSRLEIRPGKKDHMKMSEFLAAARAAFAV